LGSLAIGAGAPDTGESFKKDYVRPTSIPFPESNPYTPEKARLGEMLFFEPRLSGSNYISCASCHNPAMSWGDGLPRGIGHGMTILGRRTPTILNLAWAELLMWDGRKESLEDQALGPVGADVEMNQDLEKLVPKLSAIREYRTLFNLAFPTEGITIDTVAKAIATYERTVVSGAAPFDRWIAGERNAISESAKRGFVLFNTKANCSVCHSGWNFTDGSFHDIGLPSDDVGRGKHVPIERMQHAFKTPTLRDIARRAPYMHDGSVADLAAVVEHYDDGFVERPSLSGDMKRLGLTAAEKKDLVEFMLTLTGDNTPVRVPVLPPNPHLSAQVHDEE
jgi:cytochrome c peroxidase